MARFAQGSDAPPVAFLLDDDSSFLDALARNLRLRGIAVCPFGRARDYLAADDGMLPGCLVADLQLPEMNGLEVQQVLLQRGIRRPIVFLSGYATVPVTVRAMKAGAMTLLCKPVAPDEIAASVTAAIQSDVSDRARTESNRRFDERIASLTSRELQVLELVTLGLLNKQIAAHLGSAEKTIKMHRSHLMRKLGVRSAAGLLGALLRHDYSARHGCRQQARESIPGS